MLPLLLLGCAKEGSPAPAAAEAVRRLADCEPPNGCLLEPLEPLFTPGPARIAAEVALLLDDHGCRPEFIAGQRIDVETRTVTLWGDPTPVTLARTGLCRALPAGGVVVELTLPAGGEWTFTCVDTTAECRFVRILDPSR
jgi:hypothetical protein